jgi:protein SCO1/2
MALPGVARAQGSEPGDRTDPLPEPLKGVGQAERLNAPLPLDLPWVDSDGRAVTLREFFDGKRPVILTLNYSNCPQLCSLQLNGLFEGLQKLDYDLGDKYRMITVSLDPEEPPARAEATRQKYLAVYARASVDEGWHCLVGREANVRKLADTVGFAYALVPGTKPKQYAHAAVTILCTPDGRVSRYLYGLEYDPKTLRLALLEAGEGKIGTTTDRILLYCFAYDPQAGSYSLQAVRVMQAGGILTLAVLGGVLSMFWVREFLRHRSGTPPPSQESSPRAD